jgi:hypothetical protein
MYNFHEPVIARTISTRKHEWRQKSLPLAQNGQEWTIFRNATRTSGVGILSNEITCAALHFQREP